MSGRDGLAHVLTAARTWLPGVPHGARGGAVFAAGAARTRVYRGAVRLLSHLDFVGEEDSPEHPSGLHLSQVAYCVSLCTSECLRAH